MAMYSSKNSLLLCDFCANTVMVIIVADARAFHMFADLFLF